MLREPRAGLALLRQPPHRPDALRRPGPAESWRARSGGTSRASPGCSRSPRCCGSPSALGARGSAPRRQTVVVAAYLVPYLTVLALFNDTFERFVLPALPFLACFAAWGAAAAARRFGPRAAAILMLPALVGCASSARLAFLHSRPDTLEEAADWVRAHIAHRRAGVPLAAPELHPQGLVDRPAAAAPGGRADRPGWLAGRVLQRLVALPEAPARGCRARAALPHEVAHPADAGRDRQAPGHRRAQARLPGRTTPRSSSRKPDRGTSSSRTTARARRTPATSPCRMRSRASAHGSPASSPTARASPSTTRTASRRAATGRTSPGARCTARTTGPALEVWHVSAERLAAEE